MGMEGLRLAPVPLIDNELHNTGYPLVSSYRARLDMVIQEPDSCPFMCHSHRRVNEARRVQPACSGAYGHTSQESRSKAKRNVVLDERVRCSGVAV